MEKFFSIIIPIYNCEEYLNKCLNSVLSQTFSSFEIICVNDGSKDNSLKILKEFETKDKRIKIINKKNEGQGIARNLALEMAEGKYVLCLDSDDWLEEGALKKLFQKLESLKPDILIFNYKKFDETTKKSKEIFYNKPFYERFEEKLFSKEEAKDILFSINALPFKVYRREFLIENNIKYAPTRFIEDHSFMIKAFLLAESFCCLNEFISNYRVHSNSTTSLSYKYIDAFEKVFYLCTNIFEKYKFDDGALLASYLENRMKRLCFYFSIMPLAKKKKYFDMAKRIVKYIDKTYGARFLKTISHKFMYRQFLENSFLGFELTRIQIMFNIKIFDKVENMANYLDLYKEIHLDRIIKNLAKKYKNKKVVIYGAGIMARVLFENYDLKELPIVAICDKKFNGDEGFFGYKTISPSALKDLDFDVVLVLLKQQQKIKEYLKYDLLFDLKKEDFKVESFLKLPFSVALKELFF